MKYLIIYAHPVKDSHSGRTLSLIKDKLGKRKDTFEVIDLYKDKFDPTLYKNELYTSGGRDVSELSKKYQEKIVKAKTLIFIYPVWWSAMPAIMKGFFDKVFTARFAFTYKGKMPVGLLKNKAIVISSHGASRMITKLFTGDIAEKMVIKNILKFCGVKAKYYGIYTQNKKVPEKDLNKIVNKALKT